MKKNLAIFTENLSKIYNKKNNKVKALENFSINIPNGCIYGLLGPNGAGKSTFINIIAGLVKKNSGRVNITGIDLDKNPIEIRKKIGVVPQELNIDPFFTPYELLELQAGLYGVKKQDRKTIQILKNMQLIDKKNAYARNLSGGMRRRLLIAKALVHNPDIIFLDEPTAGVDVELRMNLWEYIKSLCKQGKTICLTTHYLEEAEKLCDYITIIDNGKKIIEDKKDNLLNLFTKRIVEFEIECKIVNFPINLKKYLKNQNHNKLTLEYDKKEINLSEIIKILNDYKILFSELKTFDEDLESIFLKITSD
ncbi:ABC transporter ATP-binding protein [Pelagibacterales bacterium SAG-MED31]|nr:ABC transporter ATP-binding protein [Pelagibacterales bacterium SAG-MED31]